MKFLNLTPHPITIVEGDQSTMYPVGGPAPRLAVERESLGQIAGISVVRSTMGEPTGLPDPQDGVIMIVSALVAEHPSVANRADLAYPGEAIRDANGKIVGANGLCAGPGLAGSMRHQAELAAQAAALPTGWKIHRLTSEYYGSHHEYGEGDEDVVLALPHDAHPPALRHGHNTSWRDQSDFPPHALIWDEHEHRWYNSCDE